MKQRRVATLRPRLAIVELRTAPPPPKQADSHYLDPAHRAWANDVCERDRWRCQWIEADDQQCQASRDRGDVMVADHIIEIKDGGARLDRRNGQCLCTRHNTIKGLQARAKRLELSGAADAAGG